MFNSIHNMLLYLRPFYEDIAWIPKWPWVVSHGFVAAAWNEPNMVFIMALGLRYWRLVVHVYSYLFFYQACPLPTHPKVLPKHAHVILPTIDPLNSDFESCILSCLGKEPGCLTIVTAGTGMLDVTRQEVQRICHANGTCQIPSTTIAIIESREQNKRTQIADVIKLIAQKKEKNRDTVIVLLDDHVQWPHQDFLKSLLAPFEDSNVALVGTNKRVKRERGDTLWSSFLNFVAVVYLERHNFEIRATNAIDGGVFVVSGRTLAVRAEVVMEDAFLEAFTSERFFFGRFGPLTPDDDNFITRYVVNSGKDVKIQYNEESLIITSLGTVGGYQKFSGQLLRWARTTWRSNSCSVFTDRTVWRRQPWCLYAEYFKSFTNFALFVDPIIVYLWHRSSYSSFPLWLILTIIFGSKSVKLLSHFGNEPKDLVWFPCYVGFAYSHSLVKLWALLTFWNCAWLGRTLEQHAYETSDESADFGDRYSQQASDLPGVSQAESDVSSTSSTVSETYGKSITTPHGRIHRFNEAFTPANVWESSLSRISCSFGSPSVSSGTERVIEASSHQKSVQFSPAAPSPPELHSTVLKNEKPSDYNRSFNRVQSCERIHADGSHTVQVSQSPPCCSTPILRNRPIYYVVPERPRF